MAVEIRDYVLFKLSIIYAVSCLCYGWRSMCLAQATNTIKPGQVIAYSDKMLVSNDGRFHLGFFNLTFDGYFGIRYTYSNYDNVVWIANRESAIYGGNISLALDAGGLLKIVRGEDGYTFPLNSNRTAPNSTATLEDSGNLVVRDGRHVLWESFDYPTDTLLPGMKLGKDSRTGKEWKLTSWLSDSNPGSGLYTLEYVRNATGYKRVLVVRARGREDYHLPSKANSMRDVFFEDGMIKYGSGYGESYFEYSLSGGLILSLRITPDGGIGFSNLTYKATMYSACYNLQTSLYGCFEEGAPRCRTGKDRFVLRQGTFSGDVRSPTWHSDVDPKINLIDCWIRCWKNCSCVGYDTYHSDATGCRYWSVGAEFQQSYDGSGSPIYILEARFPIVTGGKSRSDFEKVWMWVVISAVGFAVTVLVMALLCCLRRRKLKKKEESILKELTTSDGFNNKEEIVEFDRNKGHDLKLFSFASVLAATDNFSVENKLGQGGFGLVFKGKLPEGQEIAVKRLSRSSGQGLVEFKNELILIAKLQHTNLVRLLGCCVRGDEKILIYEYMPNKSLDVFLFDPKGRESLDWERRYNIIEGIAQGLLYLHKYSRLRIIHRDLKASNILLDKDMNPKISDFGLARIFRRNESEANTNIIVGTYGYMSPEYAMEGNFSEKSDVYSFGVLMLEIVSGRRNTGLNNPDRPTNLIGNAWQLWKEGRSEELIDSILLDHSARQQGSRFIHVGLLCVQDNAADRPTMRDVVSMIANQSLTLSAPKQVSATFQRQTIEANSSRVNQDSSFVSTTVTEFEPR